MEMLLNPERYRPMIATAKKELETNILLNRQKRLTPYSYERQSDWRDELRVAARDLQDRPFDAARHARIAHALVRIKVYGGATMHFRHAIMLEPDNPTRAADLQALMESPRYQERMGNYFVSVSNEEPPFRASRQTGEYNRKKEPAFPVYSRAGNRVSVAAE